MTEDQNNVNLTEVKKASRFKKVLYAVFGDLSFKLLAIFCAFVVWLAFVIN